MAARQMRKPKTSFDLNLAPILDIIVSIIPMLLLSVAFIQVKMIETPIPQVVADKIAEQKQANPVPVTIELKVSKADGFTYVVTDKGQVKQTKVAAINGELDFAALKKTTIDLKRQYTDIFKVDLTPAATVSFDDIVRIMDTLRRITSEDGVKKFAFMDTKSGQQVETDYMFTDVTFSNVVGD